MAEEKLVMKPHAIMIAVPLQGHLNPFVHLAIKLASKGITVTFAHIEYVHHLISKSHNSGSEVDIFSEARNSGLDIRYATISDGFPLEFNRNHNIEEYWDYLLKNFVRHVDEFVGDLIGSSDPSLVHFLVADTVSSWAGTIAKKYNMVHVSFWTQPALVFAINYYLDLLKENGHFPAKDNHEHIIKYIPGVESISTKDLMSFLQESDETTIIHKIIFRSFEDVRNADFILHNVVQELEPHTLSSLDRTHPTYAVGPISFSTKINVSKSLLPETDCTSWLDSKPTGSVLYVSFGSIVQTGRHVIQEIAKGLLLSDMNFIWAVRADIVSSADDAVLPVGYEDDVKDRGLVVQWCDQNVVLSHPAIGGFLTHCGWNSILESVWCGVPMICYPVMYDQPTNRKLVVDDWRVGINLRDDIGGSVSGEEVAMKVKMLMMSGERSDGVRNEVKKLRGIFRGALVEEGSSETNFDHFLKDLGEKIHAKRVDA